MALHDFQKQLYKKIGIIAALVILPVAGFFAGIQYQKQTSNPAAAAANARNGRFGGMLRGRAIGTVKSIGSSITVTSRADNTDKTYTLTGSTTYRNGTATAGVSDIKVGDTVLITPDNSDSSKAATVTINPATMFRGSSDGSQAPDSNGAILQ